MALFIGEFEQVIDSKHRLAISAALREQINPAEDGESFILIVGPDRHLWLYPHQYYRRLVASTVRRSALPDRRTRKIHLLTAMAREVKPDSQGRIVLPEKSMQRGLISERVTLVGIFDHIEVWPTDEWEKHVEQALPTYGDELYEVSDSMNVNVEGGGGIV